MSSLYERAAETWFGCYSSLFVQDIFGVATHVFFVRGGGRNEVGSYVVVSMLFVNKLTVDILFYS